MTALPLLPRLDPTAALSAASATATATGSRAARLELEFVRQAPFLPDSEDLAAASSAVTPWPHQLRAMRRAVRRYPEGFLFCDEVGLGKTVEAGLALRGLWISRRVRRALLLVPAALLDQWQQELHEKFALEALILRSGRDGDRFLDVRGRDVRPAATGSREKDDDPNRNPWNRNPWNRPGLILASSQLARRRERRRQLLAAEPWDLVIVDEAHHARRRDPDSEGYRPNRLLELLAGGNAASPEGAGADVGADVGDRVAGDRRGLVHRCRCLWLLTATPMQIHPQEYWDLLALIGVRQPEPPGTAPGDTGENAVAPRQRIFRETRDTLRRYRAAGLVDAAVPTRRPENVWIELGDDARDVYRKIESYLSLFYRRYEAERRGLGFVMTVYRRRLTSSFAAIRRSLLRRRERLRAGELGSEAPALRGDRDSAPGLFDSASGADELAHLDAFLDDLAALEADPKVDKLRDDLRQLLARRDRVLVFTQYLDTLDHLRDVLAPEWRVACWSGRGGEVRRAGQWIAVGKEDLKAAFGRGEVQVLLATDAASEGLNLQSCGVLVHFDLPWNPMRVEQRIGRVDRIGQAHDEVWIRSYFYAGTVEAEVYRRLAHRIRWFEQVVGRLQPILHQVGETLAEVAMLPPERRQRPLEERLTSLGQRADELESNRLSTDLQAAEEETVPEPSVAELSVPVEPAEVEEIVQAVAGNGLLTPDPDSAGVYRLRLEGRNRRVTFRPEVYDAQPYSTRLLTWGVPLFDRLLDHLLDRQDSLASQGSTDETGWSADDPGGVGLYRSERPAPVSLFLHPGGEAASLEALRRLIRDAPAAWRPDEEAEVTSRFSALRRRALRVREDIEDERRREDRRALCREAARCLEQLALLELIEAENPGLFDRPLAWGFGRRAVRQLGRHGAPLDALVTRLEKDSGLPAAQPDAAFYVEARGHRRGWRERRRRQLVERADDVLQGMRTLDEAESEARRRLEEPSAGMLARRWLRLGDEPEAAAALLDAADVTSFADALPALGDLDEAAGALVEAAEEGRDLLAELAARPDVALWLADGRASRRRFAARIDSAYLEPRAPGGSWLVFEAESGTRAPRPGDLYLLRVDGTTWVRRIETRADEGGTRLLLHADDMQAPSFVVDDPEPGSVQVLARLVGVVS